MNQSTVLVTGAAGFIGSHLVERLLGQGRRVVGLDNFCDFYDPAAKRRNVAGFEGYRDFELVEGDLRDRGAVNRVFERHRPGCVVHLAAMAGVRPSIERPGYYTEVNIDGTVNVLDAAVAAKTERFIFGSSSSVYGNNSKVPFSEEDPVNEPISPYAATKRAGELICHTYSHLYGMPIVCLRFFTVFGPRQRPDLAISKFLRLIDQGQPIPVFGDGTTSRDYTYVDDIVAGVVAAMERVERYRIYNLGGNHPVSLSGLIETIERVTGRKAQIQRLPMQPGDVERTWADLSRSEAELGYKPTTSLEEGIAKQWQWYQEAVSGAAGAAGERRVAT